MKSDTTLALILAAMLGGIYGCLFLLILILGELRMHP